MQIHCVQSTTSPRTPVSKAACSSLGEERADLMSEDLEHQGRLRVGAALPATLRSEHNGVRRWSTFKTCKGRCHSVLGQQSVINRGYINHVWQGIWRWVSAAKLWQELKRQVIQQKLEGYEFSLSTPMPNYISEIQVISHQMFIITHLRKSLIQMCSTVSF